MIFIFRNKIKYVIAQNGKLSWTLRGSYSQIALQNFFITNRYKSRKDITRHRIYLQRNMEERSRKLCLRGLYILGVGAPYYFVICGVSGCKTFSTLSHKRHDYLTNIFEKIMCKSYIYWTVHHCDCWRISYQLDVTRY